MSLSKTSQLALCSVFFLAVSSGAQEPSQQGPIAVPGVSPAATTFDEKILLPKDTPLRLMVTETISSKTAKPGDALKLQAVSDVKVDGIVVIARGAPATGTVLEAHRAGRAWHSGNMQIQLEGVTLVDGQKLPLHFPSTAKGGPTGAVADWAQFITQSGGFGVLLLPIAPIQRGNEAQFPRGSVFNAIAANETLLNRETIKAAQPPPATPTKHSGDRVTVYYYPNIGGTWYVELWCGRQKLAILTSGTNVSFDLPPGSYALHLKNSNAYFALQAEDGAEHYLQTDGIVSLKGVFDPLKFVDHDLGAMLAEDTKPVKPTPDISKLDPAKLQAVPKHKRRQ